ISGNQEFGCGFRFIAAPHPGLCPLSVAPAGERSDDSNHDELLAMMGASTIGAHVADVNLTGADMAAVVALERRIVELCEQDLGATRYAANAAGQLALTDDASVGAADGPGPSQPEHADDRGR